jgi:redox-sensing transcriptional repressor
MDKNISEPSIVRLCLMYRLLEEMKQEGVNTIFSSTIGEQLGIGAHNIRKDISMLGEIGNTLAGYDVEKLKQHINNKLCLDRTVNTCIIGLGSLGSALLENEQLSRSTYKIVIGFDNDINKLELLKNPIDVYPSYKMEEMIDRYKIEIAILAVPKHAAQATADRIIKCGIKGIVNFAPVVIKSDNNNIFIRNIDLLTEIRILSALMTLKS